MVARGLGLFSLVLGFALIWIGATTRDDRLGILLFAGALLVMLGVGLATGVMPPKRGALYFP